MAATKQRKRKPKPPAPSPIFAEVVSVNYITHMGFMRGKVTEIRVAINGEVTLLQAGDEIAFMAVEK